MTATATDQLQTALRRQFDELVRTETAVRHGDAEAVHDMRVAVRRLRSFLRTAKPMLDERWVESLRDELDWLGQMLGAVRDPDVLSAALKHQIEELHGGDAGRSSGLLEPLKSEHDEAHARLVEGLNDERYAKLLAAVEAAAEAPPSRRSDKSLRKLAKKELRRLRKRGTDVPLWLSDEQLHKRRIRVKRARYAAELVEPSVGKKASRFIDAAKDVQDVLGDHQDAVVAAHRLRLLARQSKTRGAALVAGRLLEQQEQRRSRTRNHELPPAWHRLQKTGKRAW